MKMVPPRHFFLWLSQNLEHPIEGSDDLKASKARERYDTIPDALKIGWIKKYHSDLLCLDETDVINNRVDEISRFLRNELKKVPVRVQHIMRTPEHQIDEA